MATTTNFGWETPDDSDLVKDGAAAMRTLGNSIDASFVDLKGGTSGQVLSKNSNTDLDFTWVAQDDSNAIQNAIVDAKGDLIAASGADTPARLAVGTNEHRLVAASAETTGLKYVADTTNYAIAAKGDLLVGTAADTLQALSVGTNGYTLVADSGETTGLKWAAPSTPTWTTYTPTLTGYTVGNGTSTWRYATSGKITFVYGTIKLGSTSSITGSFSFTLPNTISQIATIYTQIGYAELEDAGTTNYFGVCTYYSVDGKVYVYVGKADGTYLTQALVSSTVPFTWTTNDSIDVMCWYQEA